MSAKILIVEDEPAIRSLLDINLRRVGHTPMLAMSAESAIITIEQTLPDLVLIDWMLQGMPGVDLVRKLRAEPRTRKLPLIMLTARDQEQDKILGLNSGADDYISKPFSIGELLARIQAIFRRILPEASAEIILQNGLKLIPATQQVSVDEREIILGPSEFRLLRYFMSHPNRIHTRTALIDQVWGDHVYIAERTIDVHIRRLRIALQQVGREDSLVTVRGSGYIFSVPALIDSATKQTQHKRQTL